ncbi:DUF6151 family protein [Fodinicurvata sediminis]|uniref:DUF6151 family protein n=1 Tax=Fodinicurvata sediminis TaxID=1121832 RepID=UPI0003B7A6C6|nr:DUF6151 family protein [Fodinicurvata sediminis]
MTSLGIRCHCGCLQGTVRPRGCVNRCLCYCDDCQAFACFLGRQEEMLDPYGGTEILHLSQDEMSLAEGRGQLACMRLTEKGTLRWYATCCSTPIGNTVPNRGFPVVGLVRACLDADEDMLQNTVGPIRMQVFTKYALQAPAPKVRGLFRGAICVLRIIGRGWLKSAHRHSPFFDAHTGKPAVVPRVLSQEERARVKVLE